jgi:hypothetical protein
VPAVAALALWAANTSLLSRFPEDKPLRLIAHRGQHQLFGRTGLVWTNRIEATRPEVERRGFRAFSSPPAICR